MKQTTNTQDKSSDDDPLSLALLLIGILLIIGSIATVVADILLSSLPPETPQVPIDNPGEQSEFTPAPPNEPSLG